jgi:two-component system, OmpR family, sensor kinase
VSELPGSAFSLQKHLMICLAVVLLAAAGLSSALDAMLRDSRERARSAAKRLDSVIVLGLAAAWDRAEVRDGFIRELANRTGRRVELRDLTGTTLFAWGDESCATFVEASVENRGSVALCDDGALHRDLAMRIIAPLAAAAVIWLCALVLARRLTGPLDRLRQTAETYASGDLAKRIDQRSGVYEIEVLAEALQTMANRVAVRIESQRDVLASVSHELRSPVARLRLLVDLIDIKADVATITPEMSAELDQLSLLIDNLMASARIDFDAVRKQECSIGLAVASVARGRQVRCYADGWVHADPTLLARALSILIDNAFSHGAAPVSVSVQYTNANVGVTVSDCGPGFDAEVLSRGLPRFMRGSKAIGSGVGLGLHLVRRIAEAHAGSLVISNGVEGGANAVIWISVRPSPVCNY